MRGLARAVFEAGRSALAWGVATSVVTSAVSALARALCLPPYWPRELVLRCRPEGMLPALARAIPDTAITAMLLVVPATGVGITIIILSLPVRNSRSKLPQRIVMLVAGIALWLWAISRLEVSYLDFIVSSYASAAGALCGTLAVVFMERRSARGHHGGAEAADHNPSDGRDAQ